MTTILLLGLLLAGPAAAQSKPDAAGMKPPANAEKTGPDTYRAKDAQGKAWIYKQGPFGWIRMAESEMLERDKMLEEQRQKSAAAATAFGKAAAPASVAAAPAPAPGPGKPVALVVQVQGDTVSFERVSPFGKQRWSKKQADLNDEERAGLERWNAQRSKQ